jgi:cysteine synthase A
MPDSMSIERRRLMLAYGASFADAPREKGMNGSIARAKELLAATPTCGCRSSSRTRPTSTCTCAPRPPIAADFPEGWTR